MSKIECKQAINGILLVNKPQGLTSNALLQRVKRLFRAKKVGHTGSLDPLATGMLPLCFGEATKLSQYLLDADKCYKATGLLGIKTTTADALGEVLTSNLIFSVSKAELESTLSQFRGEIQQIPSMYSALKHKGTPLYKYARDGITIERQARSLTIHQLELNAFDGKQFDIQVACSKGTYIRNLVEDIGDFLGVGAHLIQLHRVHTAGFANEPMYSLEDLERKTELELATCLLPMERAVNYLPSITLSAAEVFALHQGKVLKKPVETQVESCLRLYDEEAQFVGLGILDTEGNLRVKRLLAKAS